jgi:hypothetical protein
MDDYQLKKSGQKSGLYYSPNTIGSLPECLPKPANDQMQQVHSQL